MQNQLHVQLICADFSSLVKASDFPIHTNSVFVSKNYMVSLIMFIKLNSIHFHHSNAQSHMRIQALIINSFNVDLHEKNKIRAQTNRITICVKIKLICDCRQRSKSPKGGIQPRVIEMRPNLRGQTRIKKKVDVQNTGQIGKDVNIFFSVPFTEATIVHVHLQQWTCNIETNIVQFAKLIF